MQHMYFIVLQQTIRTETTRPDFLCFQAKCIRHSVLCESTVVTWLNLCCSSFTFERSLDCNRKGELSEKPVFFFLRVSMRQCWGILWHTTVAALERGTADVGSLQAAITSHQPRLSCPQTRGLTQHQFSIHSLFLYFFLFFFSFPQHLRP